MIGDIPMVTKVRPTGGELCECALPVTGASMPSI